MTEIILNQGLNESVRRPQSYREVGVHPQTGKRGRWAVRQGAPMQVWDKKAHRLVWVRPTEVEPLGAPDDNSTVVVICDRGMTVNDLSEISEELSESRDAKRRSVARKQPKPSAIEEACREIQLSRGDEYRVGDQVFKRPSVGMLIPRNAEWAKAMADEAKKEWI